MQDNHNRDEMRDRIIEAALKRFTHYSATKTTMNEIADDLHCSKASLYYYFPDKGALHLAVLEKAGEAYFTELQKEADRASSAHQALMDMISVRHAFVKKFCRLELFKTLKDKQLDSTGEAFRQAREKETALIAQIIRGGVERGELANCDADRMASLYMLSMMGLRFALSDRAFTDDLSDAEFEVVREWQIQLAEIFIKGLKK